MGGNHAFRSTGRTAESDINNNECELTYDHHTHKWTTFTPNPRPLALYQPCVHDHGIGGRRIHIHSLNFYLPDPCLKSVQ